MALTGEWAPYWASPERALVSNIDSQRGGTSSALVSDWIMAQVTAGVVPLPEFLSAPVPAQAGRTPRVLKENRTHDRP
jgi:hypothetical protein